MGAGVLLVGVCLGPAGCTAGETADQAGTPTPSATSLTTAGADTTDVTSLYEGVGNPEADTVLVFAQGGPAPELDANGFSLLTEGMDLDQLYVVKVHQAQTLDPDPFLTADLDFEAAKAADAESVQMAADVVEVPIKRAGCGTATPEGDRSMARLIAGFDFTRYTELPADVDLSNVTYGYGETDDPVGRLTKKEIAFLEAAGAEVISDPGGHVDAIFALTGPALANAL